MVRYDAIWVAGSAADTSATCGASRSAAATVLGSSRPASSAQRGRVRLRLAQRLRSNGSGAGRVCLELVVQCRRPAQDPARCCPRPSRPQPGSTPPAGAASLERWLSPSPSLESGAMLAAPPGYSPTASSQAARGCWSCNRVSLSCLCATAVEATPLEPTPGVDARVRGTILHEALDLFWKPIARSVGATCGSRCGSTQPIGRSVDRVP